MREMLRIASVSAAAGCAYRMVLGRRVHILIGATNYIGRSNLCAECSLHAICVARNVSGRPKSGA